MFETYELSGRAPRVRANRLALCLSAVLLSQMSAEVALAASPATKLPPPRPATEQPVVPAKNDPDHPAASPWTVKNCTDHDTGSLRDIIQNQAQSGDAVDLSQLPMRCNATNSKITLSTGEIVVAQGDLTLLGPYSANGTVTISGGGASRVFHHEGAGTLSLHSLTITDGYYRAAVNAYGGCIESDSGNIYLNKTVVAGCTVLSDMNLAFGGGVSAHGGDATLVLSTVSENQANAPSLSSFGGGIHSHGTLVAKYSAISNNSVHNGQNFSGSGGGAFVRGGATILASTIDNNSATSGSGLTVMGPTTISDSTISRNVASWMATLHCLYCDSVTISNSTIAFNHQNAAYLGSRAVVFRGLSANSPLTLQSSIIADNTAGIGNIPADLFITAGYGVLSPSGADNLVIASNIASPPPGVITVTADPKLGPLQFNGGLTRTHALLPGSPALAMGNNTAMRLHDQRGNGYPRTTGPNATVDIGAFQFDTIFADGVDTQ
jgi:hypothetical protein